MPPGSVVSSRAQQLLSFLLESGRRLPDEVGPTLEGNVVDFIYTTDLSVGTAVIVEDPDRPAVDTMSLTFGNWNVITWDASIDIEMFVNEHANIFGAVS